MILQEISKDKNNNLNFIRFIAAIMVIFAHSFPLSLGESSFYPLGRLSKGQISLGGVSVCIFFFYSGFFLNRSVNKGNSAFLFFKARCLRILPSLTVVVLLCTFVLGPCITEYQLTDYYTCPQTYEYLLNSVFILKHNLPGVFEQNIYNATVNGSLWTLPVEFICYIGCYIMWRVGLSRNFNMKYTIPIFCMGYIIVHNFFQNNYLLQSILRPCAMFYCGMLCDTYRSRIHIKASYIFVCIAGLIGTTCLGILEYGIILFFPYILLYIAFGTKKKWSKFGTKYEISYTMYLCAWPIQQTVISTAGGSMNPLLNFVISMPLIIIAGFVLHISIERFVPDK